MFRLILLFLASLLSATTACAQDNTATRKLTKQNEQFKEQIIQVADNVHVAVGYSVANVSMIVGEDGVIIVDTGMMVEAAEKNAEKFREITDKPVVSRRNK